MNPENPDQVEVTRPSDALEAQQAAEEASQLTFRTWFSCASCWWSCYCKCYGHVSIREKNGNRS